MGFLFFDRLKETVVINIPKPYKIKKEWLNKAVYSPHPLKDKNSNCIYKGYKRVRFIS